MSNCKQKRTAHSESDPERNEKAALACGQRRDDANGPQLRLRKSGARCLLALHLLLGLSLLAGCATGRQDSPRQDSVTPPAEPEAAPLTALPPGAAKPAAPFEGEGWQLLFDGHTLRGWRPTQFAGRGAVQCHSGVLVLAMGDPFTGVNWTNNFPNTNYEVALDAMRVMGSDFFCGLTVPVRDACCSLIVGGWGGSLVGISSLDGLDASENETTKFMNFESGRWYRIRLRVTGDRIQAWIDEEKLVDVSTAGKKISVRPGDIELSQPFGLAAWQTTAALREIRMRPLGQGK